MNRPSRSLQRTHFVLATAMLSALIALHPSVVSAQPSFDNESTAFEYFGTLKFNAKIPAPKDVIGHEIGERFVRHHMAVKYIQALAEASDRVTIQQYGQTHQRRPLYILTITDPRNHARLDEILASNLELTDPARTNDARAAEIAKTNPAIAWLSYNVHGNEASGTDAALRVAYTLAASTNKEVRQILRNTVIVIDPCINPDGRERYVSFYDNNVGANPNSNLDASEHNEPWPGGRTNHYLFDLNRDWVWGVHPESRSRVAMYRRYMPQLHVDYHEQGMNSPYFFGAGDTPYNQNIPDESKEWFDRYGRASASAFDQRGLPYATKERFDYLYPGYGKVLPVYHGAVGLLCEQGGHSRGGLIAAVDDEHGPGLHLTLRRRTLNHFITSFAFIELTAQQRKAQLERFYRYFKGSMNVDPGATTAFIISADSDRVALGNVFDLCKRQGIEILQFSTPAQLSDLNGYFPPFVINDTTEIPVGSWIIPTGQPMGRLARALFERETEIENIDTYDITSWPVPVLFGVSAYEYNGSIKLLDLTPLTSFDAHALVGTPEEPSPDTVAMLLRSDQHNFPETLAAAARYNLFARVTGDAITLREGDDDAVPTGSLLVHTFRNTAKTLSNFTAEMQQLGLEYTYATAGYPAAGPALGNNANRRFIRPDIILARGAPLSSLSFGHTWHLLDIESPTPHTTVEFDRLLRMDIDDANVIILPSSRGLSRDVRDKDIDKLKDWVRAGGTIVAIGSSARWASTELLDLDDDENATDEDDDDDKDEADDNDDDDKDLYKLTWDERDERSIRNRVPGAVIFAELDTSHPLTAGMDTSIGFHMFAAKPLSVADDGYVVARFGEFDENTRAPRIGGSISDDNLAKLAGTPAVTHHRLGGGTIICFASDPTNRAMNKVGMRLLLNCILLGPSMSSALQPLGEDAHEHD